MKHKNDSVLPQTWWSCELRTWFADITLKVLTILVNKLLIPMLWMKLERNHQTLDIYIKINVFIAINIDVPSNIKPNPTQDLLNMQIYIWWYKFMRGLKISHIFWKKPDCLTFFKILFSPTEWSVQNKAPLLFWPFCSSFCSSGFVRPSDKSLRDIIIDCKNIPGCIHILLPLVSCFWWRGLS